MAYNVEKLTKLKHLEELARRIQEDFATREELSTAVQSAIAASGTASFRTAEAIPEAGEAEENVLYLVMNAETGYYDIYAKIEGAVVRLDDTGVDLEGYVEKEEGKGLSSNDFTDALKVRLEAVPELASDAEVAEMLNQVFGGVS